jgi:hypothetical protein
VILYDGGAVSGKLAPTGRPGKSGLGSQRLPGGKAMCRNIRPLFNFEPPASAEEVQAAAVQFVRKVSGSTRPSSRNAAAFERAVEQVSAAVGELLRSLETTRPPKNRAEEAAKARLRTAARFS